MPEKTTVSIEGDSFLINGRPTYTGREWNGRRIEGLLMNSRMVQGIFDDRNPETRSRFDYPDGEWNPDRNTDEFIAAMPLWRAHGLTGFTINLQGGSPEGYSKDQPWLNSAIEPDGALRDDHMARLARIIDKADELGMVAILGIFYFGQEPRLNGEDAITRAVAETTDWLCERGDRNVVIEIANEVNITRYSADIIKPPRCHELIGLVQDRSASRLDTPAGRLLVSASMGGGALPPGNIFTASDFILLHGNGVKEPDRIRRMVANCRAMPEYREMPILFNEDDHFDFDKPENNMIAAVDSRAGWGFFDYRMKDEGFEQGYQSVPVDWGINSERKKGFFGLLAEMTGANSDE